MAQGEACGVMKRVGMGAAAGVAGTMALQGLIMAVDQVAPHWEAPMVEDPGRFMARKGAEKMLSSEGRKRVPAGVIGMAGFGMALGYGAAFAVVYALARPRGGPRVVDGVMLGLTCWAVGYLGWLPAAGLMKPVWRQRGKQVAEPILEHVVFGVAVVAAYDFLRGKW